MRITGGEYSGRIVKMPEGDLRIRPSMDRMRQSVF
ncbi:MAG: RsmD family RNA methyltransferase, partial [Rectinema sp.]